MSTADQNVTPGRLEGSSRTTSVIAVLLAFAFAAATIGLFVSRSGVLHRPNRFQADAVADWLTAKAALDGFNPYQDPARLGRRYGVPYHPVVRPGVNRGEHFRPPGALVLLAPITRASSDSVFPATVALNSVLLIVLALLTARLLGIGAAPALFFAPLATLALPMVQTFEWGSQSSIIAVLVISALLLLRDGDSLAAGILIGIAATLKLYPALLAIPLFAHGRSRAAWTSLATVAGLQLAGLAFLPGVSLERTLRGLQTAGEAWGTFEGNNSIAGAFARLGVPWSASVMLALLLAISVLWVARKRLAGFADAYLVTLLVATMVSPLSWTHYDVALIAGAGWLILNRLPAKTAVAVAIGMTVYLFSWPLVLLIQGPPGEFPGWSLAGRTILLGTVLFSLRPPGQAQPATLRFRFAAPTPHVERI